MTRKIILTQEGLQKLTKELEHVKNVKFPYAINRVIEAKKHGNPAEIKDAKEESLFYKNRVNELQNMLDTAKII